MQRYATRKQVDELAKAVHVLAETMITLAQWQVYHSMKQNPYIVPQKIREEILTQTIVSDPLLYCNFKELFLQNPPVSFERKVRG